MKVCSGAFSQRAIRRRGYTLFEALIALSILFLLLYVVGDAVTRMLHSASMSAGRASQSRTISELATRISEEARSSTAVFIPASDVLGNANSGSDAHEVDFFRRQSAGGDAYVAYRFDSGNSSISRYEYSLVGGAPSIAHTDLVADRIAAFSASRAAAGSMTDIVDSESVNDVQILYGVAGVVGGNDVVIVSMQAEAAGGVTPAAMTVHLASRAAPTSLSLLTPAKPPPPAGGGPITIPFIIRTVPLRVPHGPWHSGGPGSDGDGQASGIHLPWVAGLLTSFGGDSGFSWLDLASVYPIVESGTYVYRDASGKLNTITISCNGSPCPRFKPMPTGGVPAAPAGGVGFDASP